MSWKIEYPPEYYLRSGESEKRLAPNFNGSNQLAEYGGKLVDVDNLDGLVLEGYFQSGDGTFFSQNTLDSSTSREFQIFELSGNIRLLIGGTQTTISQTAPDFAGVYRFEFLPNSEIAFYHNDSLIRKTSYSSGAQREPTALFRVGARASGAPATYSFFKSGFTYNIKRLNISQYAQTPIKTVVIFGASIMEQSFGVSLSATKDLYAAKGVDVEVVEHASSGDDTNQMKSKIPTILSGLADPTSTLFVIHWGGNDASRRGPYPGGATTMDSNCRDMCTQIKSAGCKLAISTITYRIPPASNPTAPYNDNFMNSVINDFADVPMDLYALTFNNQATWFDTDGIHPNAQGESMTRQYVVDVTSQLIKSSQANQTQLLNDWRLDDGFTVNPQLKDYTSGQDMEAKNFDLSTWVEINS